jgi:hypothetical protein
VTGDLSFAACVVQRSLNATVHTADGQKIRLVEVRYRPVMLDFPVLDDEVMLWPIAVNGEPGATPRSARVAPQPVEAVLPAASLTKHLITEVEHVRLIASFSPHPAIIAGSRWRRISRRRPDLPPPVWLVCAACWGGADSVVLRRVSDDLLHVAVRGVCVASVLPTLLCVDATHSPASVARGGLTQRERPLICR